MSSYKITNSLCPIFTKFQHPRQIFIEVPGTKFHGNPSSGRHAATCGKLEGQTRGMDRRTEGKTKVMVLSQLFERI
jgi:hypothetical protein